MKSVRQPQRIFTVAVFLLLGVAGSLPKLPGHYRRYQCCDHRARSRRAWRGGGRRWTDRRADRQAERVFFDGKADFEEVEAVADGLGPRMNLDSCAGCHAQPATGGTSPFVNPQVAFASKDGGTDTVPFFITLNGPVREARFKFNADGTRDGGVHNSATITGGRRPAGAFWPSPTSRRRLRATT